MSAVMAARSNCGAKPQSSRAALVSSEKRPRFRDGLGARGQRDSRWQIQAQGVRISAASSAGVMLIAATL